MQVFTPRNNEKLNEWRSQWDDWQLGFSHFVQLELEPNGDTLWFLLGRQVVGVFPRNQKGVDAVIPMIRKLKSTGESNADSEAKSELESEVVGSMILIQVKNVDRDNKFPKSATDKCTLFQRKRFAFI